MQTKFEALWQPDGKIVETAPGWLKKRDWMRDIFPPPYQSTGPDCLEQQVNAAMAALNSLKPPKRGWAYLDDCPTDPEGPDYGKARDAKLAESMRDLGEVVQTSVDLFRGMPQWNHPLTMPNVIPPANLASIVAAFMTEVFSPNIIEGEYSWNVEFSELESAAMLAHLIGWDSQQAGGLFTFGGSGCYLYGLKYALTKVLGKESRYKGIRTDGKLLVSRQGHYCKLNNTDWTGLGMDNIVEIKTNPLTNAMDLNDLEAKMQDLQAAGIPIISIVCTMGTTDAFAMDPVAEVRQLIERYPNPSGYGKPFLYCDAVIGWSWLTFSNYDFAANPLDFSPKVLTMIRENYEAIRNVVHADAIGCDFHKVGWAPYNCSLFVFKDNNEFTRLMSRPGSDYLQERTRYNPGLYTLEVSRSASYSMAAWATLKFLGHEGFQAILGSILEVKEGLKELLACEKSMICVNSEDHGFVTLLRVYPEGIDANMQYQLEFTSPEFKRDLIKHNILQQMIADKLWDWFRGKREFDGRYAPYISYSSGFRSTVYNEARQDPSAVVYALKAFPMNVNVDCASMKTLISLLKKARDEIVSQL